MFCCMEYMKKLSDPNINNNANSNIFSDLSLWIVSAIIRMNMIMVINGLNIVNGVIASIIKKHLLIVQKLQKRTKLSLLRIITPPRGRES